MTSFPTIEQMNERHARAWGHYPYNDRTVNPWNCRWCVEEGRQKL